MYLHRLTLRAIGPYADEFSVDFGALGQSGLFLLEGPTGSGKSTIIDAIVFALYGSLAGETSSQDRLHSHHAAPEVEPFVELVFETGAGLYRIRRTPQWWRPKSRGTGLTRANASATLMRLATPEAVTGEVLSTSAQEVGGEITRILGLTKQQFVQTVVLPQGEFAKFLSSSGEDRKKVLESLFGTEIYERTTLQLVDMKRSFNRTVEAADHAVDLALERAREAAGEPELTAESATSLVEQLTPGVAAARVARDDAQARVDEARSRHAAQLALAATLERRRSLVSRRAALVDAADGVEESRVRRDAGRRAASVTGPLAALRDAQAVAAEARSRLDEVVASHPALAGIDASVLRNRRDGLVAEIATVTGLTTVEAGFADRSTEALVADAEVESFDARIAAATVSLAERPAERVPLVAAVEAAIAARRDEPAAVAAVDQAARILGDVDRLAELEAAVMSAGAARDLAARDAAHAVDAEVALRRRRIEGMAGELALALVPGEACSVCGSREHPAPALLTDEHPDDETVERAAAAREAAERNLSSASAVVATAIARRDDAAKLLDGIDRDRAISALEGARAGLALSRSSAAAVDEAAAALEAFDLAGEELRTAIESDRLARVASSARAETARATLAADRETLARALDGRAPTAAELARELAQERAAVEAALVAVDSSAAAEAAVTSRSRSLTAAVTEAGFTDVVAAEAAALDRSALTRLDTEIASHDSSWAVVNAGLAEPEVASLSGDEEASVALASSSLEVASTALAASAELFTRENDRLARVDAAVQGLVAAVQASSAVAEEARAVVRMADIASATGAANVRGVTLGTYVLLRRFDDVVAAANARLAVMSSGRFQLEASESRESGSRARKTGLALAIRDHRTDTTRDPKSFSGGETFYASLSLALGLADVVQAEAGGLDLGTLFVDEGFGSLDSETLDAVMTELGRLSAHGRVVGIVSHVEELKQRIADRIEVRQLPGGSSTLSVTG
ncbi:MAG: hypothetical protein JWP75_1439 [Frondihabitans sp.]|nr:hypothetical protein [Frondihabitans sp.]